FSWGCAKCSEIKAPTGQQVRPVTFDMIDEINARAFCSELARLDIYGNQPTQLIDYGAQLDAVLAARCRDAIATLAPVPLLPGTPQNCPKACNPLSFDSLLEAKVPFDDS